MTPPQMTGRRESRDGGEVLVLERSYRAPVEDVWAAVTDPERMQRWIGTWSGDPAAGEVAFRMTAEGDDVAEEVYEVELCEPPHRFAVRSRDALPFTEDASGPALHWRLRLELAESDGGTALTFTQAVADGPLGVDVASSVGPGWEYYLARLTAALDGADVDAVRWEEYEPGSAYYRELFASR